MIGTRLISLFAIVLACLLGFSAAVAFAEDSERPNFLIITADNLGYGDVGCYGNRTVKTPNIDQLAEQGVRLTDFYTASPTCTVSRACLLTGRYPQRHGLNIQLPGIKGNYGEGLSQSETIIPKLLTPLGYKTGCFGKWNIGFAPGSRPTERGFDEFFGHASGNIDYYTHVYNLKPDMHRSTEPVQVKGYSTDLFADEAIDFITRHQKQPFFAYIPFNAPHFPNARNKQPGKPNIWQAPPEAFKTYGWKPDEINEKHRYYAVITAMDTAIGRILDTLDELKLSKRTLVIFFSDNGAFMLKGRGLEVASNKPYRDGGVTLYEGGIRVPCVVRWPGKIKPNSVCREPLLSLDWLPMLVRNAGGQLPNDLIIDGRDPTATLLNGKTSSHETLFFGFGKYRALRRGKYKLISTAPSKPFELYNLESDQGETNNIADKYPKLIDKLSEEYSKWLADCRDRK